MIQCNIIGPLEFCKTKELTESRLKDKFAFPLLFFIPICSHVSCSLAQCLTELYGVCMWMLKVKALTTKRITDVFASK